MTKVIKKLYNQNVQISWAHYFAIYFWIGWLHFHIIFFGCVLPFLYSYAKGLFAIIVGILLVLCIIPVNRLNQPQFCFDFGYWLIQKATEYFKMSVVFEDMEEVKKHSPAIFAIEPHDVLPISMAFFQPDGVIPGHKCAGSITSVCFYLPIMRHVYTWTNAYSVDKNNIIKLISQGFSPVICPGGAREVYYIDRTKKEYVLYLNNRKGFIKLAYKFGIPVIPVVTLGLQNSFTLLHIKNDFLHNVCRSIGFSPVIFFGLWGTVMGPPKPCQYVNIIGKPIMTQKNLEPSENELAIVSEKYIEETLRLFNTYKHQYNMSDYTVRVV